MIKEKCRLDDHGEYRGIERNVRCEETDKRDDRFVQNYLLNECKFICISVRRFFSRINY